MSVRATVASWDLTIPNATAKLVLLVMADCYNDSNGECYPSLCTIAERISKSRSTVTRAIEWLIKEGFVAKSERYAQNGRRCSSSFTLLFMEKPKACACTTEAAVKRKKPQPVDGVNGDTGYVSSADMGVCVTVDPVNYKKELKRELAAAAEAREPSSIDRLRETLLAASGGAITSASMAEPQRWLKAGYDLETDILPTIREKAGRLAAGSVGSWAFFTQAIAQRHSTRLAPITATAPTPVTARPKSWSEQQAELKGTLRAIMARKAAQAAGGVNAVVQ